MPLPWLRYLFVLVLLLPRSAAAIDIDCSLAPVAQIPIEIQDHQMVARIGINGHWVDMLVDTGAQRTILAADTADRLGLPRDMKAVQTMIGVGGTTQGADAIVDRMVIGGVHFPINRVATAPLNLHNNGGLNADGLLGSDILLAFELDIDAPDGKLTLYRNRLCPSARPPWREPAIEILGVHRRGDKLLVPFTLDNVAGMGIVDTGARTNVIGHNMARRMNLDEQAMTHDPIIHLKGTGGVSNAHLHTFGLWQIGPIADVGIPLPVMPEDFGIGDALIGVQFLEGRRVWLSFKNPQIFITKRAGER